MCIAAIKCSSSARPLNPRAQEWYPAARKGQYLISPPVQMVPLYFRGFIPYGTTCTLPVIHGAPPPVEPNQKKNIPKPRVCNVPRQCLKWLPKISATAPPASSPPTTVKPSKTTLMLRNIPNQLSRDFMVGFLDSYCQSHSLEYDFFYLPMDFCKEKNLGYAFVNLTSVEGAIKLKGLVQDYKWGIINGTYASNKVCDIKWAATQGKEGQIRRFQKSIFECDKKEFLPVVFDPPRNGSNGGVSSLATLGALRKRCNTL